MLGRDPNPPETLPAPCRGDCHVRCAPEAPGFAKAPDQVHVFHNRERGIPADGLERVAPDEDRLVAVGQVEQRDAEANAELDRARHDSRRVEREPETSEDDPGIAVRAGDRGTPVTRQLRVGV